MNTMDAIYELKAFLHKIDVKNAFLENIENGFINGIYSDREVRGYLRGYIRAGLEFSNKIKFEDYLLLHKKISEGESE